MSKPADKSPAEVLSGLIAGIPFAMLTTIDRHGRLRSRPMTSQQEGDDGTLWFLTDRRTHGAEEITLHPQVNVSFTDSGDHRFVSCSGQATLVNDRSLARKFWKPQYAVWFPVGPDDPNLVLLRVEIDHADYWDSPNTWAGRLLAFAKALATGDKSSLETRGHVDLKGQAR
jgi:general stress protein 26